MPHAGLAPTPHTVQRPSMPMQVKHGGYTAYQRRRYGYAAPVTHISEKELLSAKRRAFLSIFYEICTPCQTIVGFHVRLLRMARLPARGGFLRPYRWISYYRHGALGWTRTNAALSIGCAPPQVTSILMLSRIFMRRSNQPELPAHIKSAVFGSAPRCRPVSVPPLRQSFIARSCAGLSPEGANLQKFTKKRYCNHARPESNGKHLGSRAPPHFSATTIHKNFLFCQPPESNRTPH